MEGNIMYKKIVAIITGTIVMCSLLVMPMVLNIKQANALEIDNNTIKMNEKVKYVNIGGKIYNNGAKVSVLHKFENKTEVNDFVSLAKSKLNQLSSSENFDQPFIATITMKKALSLKEFENFAVKYDLDICDYKLRALEKDGTRVTIGAKPTEDLLVDEDMIMDAVGENSLEGVIAFTCNVTENNFKRIIEMGNDKSVYVIDVDSYFIAKDVREQTDKDNVRVKANDIYWYLEDYKINK
jgi:hypothetical protein